MDFGRQFLVLILCLTVNGTVIEISDLPRSFQGLFTTLSVTPDESDHCEAFRSVSEKLRNVAQIACYTKDPKTYLTVRTDYPLCEDDESNVFKQVVAYSGVELTESSPFSGFLLRIAWLETSTLTSDQADEKIQEDVRCFLALFMFLTRFGPYPIFNPNIGFPLESSIDCPDQENLEKTAIAVVLEGPGQMVTTSNALQKIVGLIEKSRFKVEGKAEELPFDVADILETDGYLLAVCRIYVPIGSKEINLKIENTGLPGLKILHQKSAWPKVKCTKTEHPIAKLSARIRIPILRNGGNKDDEGENEEDEEDEDEDDENEEGKQRQGEEEKGEDEVGRTKDAVKKRVKRGVDDEGGDEEADNDQEKQESEDEDGQEDEKEKGQDGDNKKGKGKFLSWNSANPDFRSAIKQASRILKKFIDKNDWDDVVGLTRIERLDADQSANMIAVGNVELVVHELLKKEEDLDTKDLVKSFNQKFSEESSLKIEAQFTTQSRMFCSLDDDE
ncbi:hypothetical protein CRM22_000846 [Opisthorchis felineus]|uniref:Uncharacterized protein n=1 Tax=Opisthorchis felineus TaxID=147828 RepID=A0A4S2MDG5_OPIFE|nr:hypothetical protein CRM22_000846 [Opisthorchis felineus]